MKHRQSPAQMLTAELEEELRTTIQLLRSAYDRFNFTDDPELTEACIYEIKALKSRYSYLVRRLKEQQDGSCAAAAAKGGPVCPS